MNKYRSKLQIVRDILLVAASEDGTKKTRIMYGASLSYKLLAEYLDEVIKADLLEFDGRSLYTITSKGKKFLELYEIYEKRCEELENSRNHLKNGTETLRKMLGNGNAIS